MFSSALLCAWKGTALMNCRNGAGIFGIWPLFLQPYRGVNIPPPTSCVEENGSGRLQEWSSFLQVCFCSPLKNFMNGEFHWRPEKQRSVLWDLSSISVVYQKRSTPLRRQSLSFLKAAYQDGSLSFMAGGSSLQPSLLFSPLTFWGSWERRLKKVITWALRNWLWEKIVKHPNHDHMITLW